MRIHILGSAAGGGVPQWNCNCANCRAARRKSDQSPVISFQCSLRRTQSSVAVSANGQRWILLNASPDLSTQFASFPPLVPAKGPLRSSLIEAVVLTDAELDHVTGLLSLREHKELRLICANTVLQLLTKQFPLLPTLRKYCHIAHSAFPIEIAGLRIAATDLSEKSPPYARGASRGAVMGLRIEDARSGRCFAYLPCLSEVSRATREFVAGCRCLLVDGTFWSNDEMTSLGLTKRTARDMGHVPISGHDGSLSWLRELDVARKVYLHINNTNPILRPGSRERRAVERAGVEIANDGMDIRV